MADTKEQILLDIQETKRQIARTYSWKRRKDLQKHLTKMQRALSRLNRQEEETNGINQQSNHHWQADE